MGIEVALGVLAFVVLAVSTWMAIVGLMGVAGGMRFARCSACQHLLPTSFPTSPLSCAYCRHPLLLHPTHWLDRHHRVTA
jgi:hypothetical protein